MRKMDFFDQDEAWKIISEGMKAKLHVIPFVDNPAGIQQSVSDP